MKRTFNRAMKRTILFLSFAGLFSCATSPSGTVPDSDCFKYLIENRTRDFVKHIDQCRDVKNSEGTTTLMMALAKDNLDVVQALIDKGVDVNVVNQSGISALIFAANKNNKRSVQLLRRAGARIEIVNNNLSGLMLAVRNSSLELIQLMDPTEKEINIKAEDGWTALYFAISRSDPGILNYLLDHGACTHIHDADHVSPMDYAKEVKWKEGQQILKRKTKC